MADQVDAARKRRSLGGFELIAKVGRGGMGTVYKARQVSMDRVVALKILYPRLAADQSFIRRFHREARAVAKLNHRNIVQGIDAGEADGYYYFAMEFVDGETVHQMIAREGALEERLALSIVRDVAHALSHAHRYGLVHRDIKPGNIMVTSGGVTKLCDLGLAREVDPNRYGNRRTGRAIGTPYYISPEQAAGDSGVDIRSDIYSLGATLYRMVVGEVPFSSPTPADILQMHITEPLPWPKTRNPRVSDHVCHIIAKMMAKSVDERYQTPAEVAQDIDRVLNGEAPSSEGFTFEVPPTMDAPVRQTSREQIARKKEALQSFVEVRKAAHAAVEEQGAKERDIVNLIRGNLREDAPETHLKYGLLYLANQQFRSARSEFEAAAKLGAETGSYMEKVRALGPPAGMVYVGRGDVILGPPEAAQVAKVTVGAFYIDRHCVTNAEYADFLGADNHPAPPSWEGGRFPPGEETCPVVNITWNDAAAYAKWAGKRLPTEAEWERAARGEDGRLWPWGNDFDPERCNSKEGNVRRTSPLGKFPRGISPFGCGDMAGNVWEWSNEAPTIAAAGAEAVEYRIVRGGSYAEPAENVRCYARRWFKADARRPDVGFRCVCDV